MTLVPSDPVMTICVERCTDFASISSTGCAAGAASALSSAWDSSACSTATFNRTDVPTISLVT